MMKHDQNTSLVLQPEKPEHYTYLKEFRTQQCPLFLQHKCTQHRPYTCFHWHFANQRRRRPVRKRDGSFNYTPDTYCSKYDETSGTCPNGDECSLLHRNSGDTERRYHVRYYKTATCVHETDSKGVCSKNGAHCAFAHGKHDLRNPTFDVRELQAMERGDSSSDNAAGMEMSASMEKEKNLNDDPKWNDSQYVLANYKTEPCKRPPRLCRQGYACPQYHNSKDRRRNPKVYKYRSTPCPQVKQQDEWGDPAVCDNGDDCQYCHTRTEQQFYPEIYKSTKCKDMVQTGYCPRGPFCAFAHVDQEINMTKDTQMESPRGPSSLASFITPSLQEQEGSNSSNGGSVDNSMANNNNVTTQKKSPNRHQSMNSPGYPDNSMGRTAGQCSPGTSSVNSKALSSSFSDALNSPVSNSVPEPIGKGRSQSMVEYQRSDSMQSRSTNGNALGQYNSSFTTPEYARMRQLSGDLSGSNTSSLLLDSGIGGFNSSAHMGLVTSNTQSNSVSPFASSFFPGGDTVESVIGNAMEDFNLGADFHHMAFAEDTTEDRGDTASVCSSLSAGLASSYMNNSFTLPMSIPDRIQGSACSLSQSPPASPLASIPMGIPQSQNRSNRFSTLGSDLNPLISPRSAASQPMLSLTGSATGSTSVFSNGLSSHGQQGQDVSKLKEEIAMYKSKLARWEEGMTQARAACDAWKKEADEANRKYLMCEEEKQMIARQRDDALVQLRQQLEYSAGSNILNMFSLNVNKLQPASTSYNQLLAARKQLTQDLENVQKMLEKRGAGDCAVCHTSVNITTVSRASMPCSHTLLCENCAVHHPHVCSTCGASNQFTANNGDNGSAIMANKPVVSTVPY